MEERQTKNEREFSRVNARVPAEIVYIPPGERDGLGARIFGFLSPETAHILNEVESSPLAELLKIMNQKLDLIINHLAYQGQDIKSMSFLDINISGGGVSFNTKEKWQPGDLLQIKLALSQQPPLLVCLYGEVVRVEIGDGDFLMAVKFVSMEESIREKVIQFVFKRQREILREKREKGEDL